MVRRLRPLLPLVLVVLFLVPSSAAEPRDDGTPTSMHPRDHPLFSQLPAVPDATRLWAQLSSEGAAFLTLQKEVLPLPYTPPAEVTDRPAVTFEAFRHVTTNADTREVQYTSRPALAAWNATFHPDQPIVAEWLLSTGDRGTDTGATAPPLLVKTTIKAIETDGFERTLATRTVRADPGEPKAPTPVRMELDPLDRPIPQGARLVVELDWSWMRLPGVGSVRQPLVTVHPGSFVDLPLQTTLRVESLRERVVSGDLYVEAKVAHLFAVENLALKNANLLVVGPHLQAQGGRPYVTAPRDGPGAGHVATFDWRLPVSLAHLSDGTYALHVAVGQAHEPGPRVVATHHVELGDDDSIAVLPGADTMPWTLGLLALGTVGTTVALRRRRNR